MPKVIIHTPVKVDGEIHRPGEGELPEKAIKALEGSGAVTRQKAAASKKADDSQQAQQG